MCQARLLKFFLSFNIGLQRCVMMEVKKETYYDSDCKEKHCGLCLVLARINFILRGLPKEYSKINNSNNGIDSHYIFIPADNYSEITGGIQLRGYFDHGIQINKTRKGEEQWEIIWFSNSELGMERVGYVSVDQHKFPFGKRIWKLSRRGYPDKQEPVILKLSAVYLIIIYHIYLKYLV